MSTSDQPKFGSAITIAGTLAGLIIGSVGMWWTLKDRMEKAVEERVTKDIRLETRITRIEERLESQRQDVWSQKSIIEGMRNELNSLHRSSIPQPQQPTER